MNHKKTLIDKVLQGAFAVLLFGSLALVAVAQTLITFSQ